MATIKPYIRLVDTLKQSRYRDMKMPRIQMPHDVVEQLRRELKRLRVAANITQQKAADALDISLGQYSKYERGISKISPPIIELARQRFLLLRSEVKEFSEDPTPYISESVGSSELFKHHWLPFRKQLERLLKDGDKLAGM